MYATPFLLQVFYFITKYKQLIGDWAALSVGNKRKSVLVLTEYKTNLRRIHLIHKKSNCLPEQNFTISKERQQNLGKIIVSP